MKTHLHSYPKTMNLQFRVGDLDLPERRKRYSRSGVEEEEDAQIDVPLWRSKKSKESITHIVGECKMYKERDVLEMAQIDECATYGESTLDKWRENDRHPRR